MKPPRIRRVSNAYRASGMFCGYVVTLNCGHITLCAPASLGMLCFGKVTVCTGCQWVGV